MHRVLKAVQELDMSGGGRKGEFDLFPLFTAFSSLQIHATHVHTS